MLQSTVSVIRHICTKVTYILSVSFCGTDKNCTSVGCGRHRCSNTGYPEIDGAT